MRPGAIPATVAMFGVLLLAACTHSPPPQRVRVGFPENPVQVGGVDADVMAARPLGLGGHTPRGDEAYYRVSKTDTFTRIARRFYGDEKYYSELFFANEDRLAKSGGLKRGMIIVLPAMRDGRKPQSPTERP